MSDDILAIRFAKALFNLAKERKIVDGLNEELKVLEKVVEKEKKWLLLLDDETIPLKKRYSIIDDFSKKGGVSESIRALLSILSEKRKAYIFSGVSRRYNKMVIDYNGGVLVEIILSNIKIWQLVESAAVKSVSEATGRKPIFKLREDPSIIGGMIIKIKDKVYDGSVRGYLDRLKHQLLRESLGF